MAEKEEKDWASAPAEQNDGAKADADKEGAGLNGDATLADDWGAALAEQGASANPNDMAAEWATMIDDGVEDEYSPDLAGADRILTQDEIDQISGFSLHEL